MNALSQRLSRYFAPGSRGSGFTLALSGLDEIIGVGGLGYCYVPPAIRPLLVDVGQGQGRFTTAEAETHVNFVFKHMPYLLAVHRALKHVDERDYVQSALTQVVSALKDKLLNGVDVYFDKDCSVPQPAAMNVFFSNRSTYDGMMIAHKFLILLCIELKSVQFSLADAIPQAIGLGATALYRLRYCGLEYSDIIVPIVLGYV